MTMSLHERSLPINSVIHLHTHCDEDLQGAISDELDSLPE